MRSLPTRIGSTALLLAVIGGQLAYAGNAGSRPETPSGSVPQATTPATPAEPALSDEVVRDVLEPLRKGLETQNAQLVLSIFTSRAQNSSGDLPAQLHAFFHQYAEVNFRYQILQATADQDHASAVAEVQMDASPFDSTAANARRSDQMRFQLKRESKAWKVVSFSPADFFAATGGRGDPSQAK